jgi:pimeloyl-ACP methyl ester carboxylesterase
MLKWTLWVVTAVLALAAGAVTIIYRHDMDSAYARIQGRSQIIVSPVGDIEYAVGGGDGPAVLVVHGSGGGFDQGELLAQAALGEGFRWIMPSRFGYLRSTYRPGATFDDQAHAFALLLDHLGIDKLAVVAFSHGGPSALLFAALYPQRVSSLTLISAGVASSDDAGQQQASRQGDALAAIFQQDIRYWAVTTALRGWFLELMGVSDAVRQDLTPQQQRLATQLIEGMNPVSPRAAGAAFDNRASMPNQRIAAIRAPTLVLHARDDSLQLFRNAEYAGRTIPGARVVAFDHGGHLLLAVEQAAIRQEVARHILAHAGELRQ